MKLARDNVTFNTRRVWASVFPRPKRGLSNKLFPDHPEFTAFAKPP